MRTVNVSRSEQKRKDESSLKTLPGRYHKLKGITRTSLSEKKTLKPFSNSRLEDISECPTFGVVHAQKQYPQHGRALALEAGESMHQVFASMRLWQLHAIQNLPDHAMAGGIRVYGEARWKDIWKKTLAADGHMNQLATLAGHILHTSGYYDDPKDTTRTISNMETASMVFARETYQYLQHWPIWVADKKSASKPIGVEQIFDVVLEYEDGKKIRFIGTIDGILVNAMAGKNMRITMGENKTAARMDRAWIESFKMRHQITGYMACGMAIFEIEMWHARVYGCRIKPTFKGEDVHIEPVVRDATSVAHWANWVRIQVELYESYENDYEHAERRTHACNRFFRPCSLIPFCADSATGRKEQWAQMIEAAPSPSERAVQG